MLDAALEHYQYELDEALRRRRSHAVRNEATWRKMIVEQIRSELDRW